jgi:hypothetical protein
LLAAAAVCSFGFACGGEEFAGKNWFCFYARQKATSNIYQDLPTFFCFLSWMAVTDF